MNVQAAIRWFGLVLMLGGILGAISTVIRPTGDEATLALSQSWVPVHTVFVIANILLGVGLFGLYLPQADRLGAWGLIAFMLAVFAANLSVAVAAIEAYVYPLIASLPNAPKLLSEFTAPSGPLPLVGRLNLEFVILYEPGMILLSLMTLRAGDFSRAASWLLVVGSLLSNALLLGPGAWFLAFLGVEAWSLALAWLGYQVWSRQVAAAADLPLAGVKT